ncbi:TPA: lipopolysaccharide biosynthesis protein [Streptococcus suis]
MKKRLYINSAISLFYQICSVVIGLIIPRLILQKYGSEINGVVNSITQLLGFISLLDLGVGGVVQSALYKPLAEHDENKVSQIYSSATKYFNSIAKILLVYIFVLCLYYGLFKNDEFDWIFTTTLILVIAINYFTQYYLGICNTLLLNADQRISIVTLINLFVLLINTVATIVMLQLDISVQWVKLVSSCTFLLRSFLLATYVKMKYSIKKIKNPPKGVIKNQWSGLAQHIAVSVTNSVDNLLLTMFGTFSMISIYNVYVLPLLSIRNLLEVTSNSYKSFFGRLIAKSEKERLLIEFARYETLLHYICTLIMGTTLVTLIPFVIVYTTGVNDVSYKNSLFCLMITLAYFMFMLRTIYTNVIFAAGKFKETQIYSVIECLINIVLSFILVFPLGFTGVAIGTVVSSFYRMASSAWYLKKDILERSIVHFVKHMVIDFICFVPIIIVGQLFPFTGMGIIDLVLYAVEMFAVSFLSCTVIHCIAYFQQIYCIVNSLAKRIKR